MRIPTPAQIVAATRNLEKARLKRRAMHPDVGLQRADTRASVSRSVRDKRSPRHLGHTDAMWETSYRAHGRPRESLEQYKQRATAAATARGLTRDKLGFFYKPEDTKQRHPLGASGYGVGVLPPRTERHQMSRPGSDRMEQQSLAGMSQRTQKRRRISTNAVRQAGARSVGTDTGQRRAVQLRKPSVPASRTSIGRHRKGS